MPFRRIVPALALLSLLAAPLAVAAPPQASAPAPDNPFFRPYGTPFDVPPFALIKAEHFLPALKEAMRLHRAEIEAIASDPCPPTFDNVIMPLDAAGQALQRVSAVFGLLQGAETTPALEAVARETAPLLAAHRDDISLDPRLFARVKAIYARRAFENLNGEEIYLLENTYRDFVRGGALLDAAGQARLRAINKELSTLSLKFGQNLLAETNDFKLALETPADLAGLPEDVRARMADAAKQAGLPGKWLVTLQAPSWIPFLQFSDRRDLREKVFRAYTARGDRGNERDNKAVTGRIAALRAEKAKLLGYANHAAFVLENNMARDPATVGAFLKRLWTPALARAKSEAAAMQAIVDREGGAFRLAAWDWWYYAEKLRKEQYALDDAALRPYFSLESVRAGIFELCRRLYGLQFAARPEVPRWNPDVQVFEVKEEDGRPVGLLCMDFHPRPGKRGGAWSGALRRQAIERDGTRTAPVSTIVCNFTRPAGGAPALLSVDEAETFFHEFGHSLATLLASGFYRSRSAARDAVELPSQIMEHWVFEPELLAAYARHYKTGETIPAALVEKIRASRLFNQGFATVEYLAASILDMAWHEYEGGPDVDVDAFEKGVLDRAGLMPEIVSRYRTTYFNHIFNGGYAAGYYAYIWSEVLDCDAFEAFREKGIFDRGTAESFRRNVLEPFGTLDIGMQYRRFRGADPTIEPLLRKRGLDGSGER